MESGHIWSLFFYNRITLLLSGCLGVALKSYKAEHESSDVLFEDPYVGMEEIEEDDSESGFPDEHVQPLRGLLFVGSLFKNFTYAGHDFLIETLREGDVLRIGQMLSSHQGASSREARKVLVVAACVKSVDGYALVTDISAIEDNLPQRMKIVEKWYPPVVDYVYRQYVELEKTEYAVADSLKK